MTNPRLSASPFGAATLFLVLCVIASPASAKTLQVPKGFPTIGAAVLAAAAGDTIVISSGIYAERVVIPVGLSDLKIQGKGNAVIDAFPTGGSVGGIGLDILASGVRVSHLTVQNARNGSDKGVGIFLAGPGARVEDVRVVGCQDRGIWMAAPNCTLTDSTVIGNLENVYVPGAQAKIIGVESRGAASFDVTILGSSSLVKNCRLGANSAQSVIYVAANDVKLIDNEIVSPGHWGIALFAVGGVVKKNRIVGGNAGVPAIYIAGDSYSVDGNTIEDVGNVGISVSGMQNEVRKNVVRRASLAAPGFLVTGNVNILEDNSALDCANDGFRITGAANLLVDNLAKGNGKDGFDVAGSSNQLVTNHAQQNSAEGFENSGSGSVFEKNVASKNRIDLANDGSFTFFTKNVYETGGLFVPPEID